MNIMDIPCNAANYGGLRGSTQYLVVHYTAGKNDTAADNGRYFQNNAAGASAHYFVDENAVVRSVPEDRAAWHCGGAVYTHPACRNGNSIGVEICTKWNGGYFFAEQALENAKALLRELMQRYAIPAERVLRHYDVTGKLCPMPFVGAGLADWEAFKGGLQMYNTLEQVPGWAKATVQKLADRGVLAGDGEGLKLSMDLTRTLVILDRLGLLEEQKKEELTCHRP